MTVLHQGILVNFVVICVYKSAVCSKAKDSHLKVHSVPESTLLVLQFTDQSSAHAESPVWDERTQTLYWVDTTNQQVHALDYPSFTHRSKEIGYGEVNIVVPVEKSKRLLVCVRSELYLMDWQMPGDSALRLVASVDMGRPNNLVNEGKADASGRFWVGTKGPQVGDQVTPDEATFYSIGAPDFNPRVQVRPVSISNGLVWTRNNSVMYYIDSATKKIEAFDFDVQKGQISKRRTILDVEECGFKDAIPDGMTIDKEGMLWVALMFNGSVIRVDPDTKEILELYKLPVSRVTSVAWMGKDMNHLVITTSRRNLNQSELEEQPLAGSLFILRNCTTSGKPDYKFYFPHADDY